MDVRFAALEDQFLATTIRDIIELHAHWHVTLDGSNKPAIEPNNDCKVLFESGCFRHQLLLPRPYLVLTKPLRLDIQCQRGASVKIGWKYLDD